jgi:hypothetical protein
MTHNQQETITLTSSVTVPLLQATVTGVLIGTTAGAGAWALSWENPGAVGLAIGAATATVAWLNYREGWEKRISAVLGIQQQAATSTAAYAQTVRVEVISDNAHAGDYLNLPGGRDRLMTLAQGLTSGKPLTVRTWAGGGGLYAGAEFDRLRTELIARGLARWQSEHDHRAGVTLTAKGAATMRGLALASATPTPSLGFHLEELQSPQDQSRSHRHTIGE